MLRYIKRRTLYNSDTSTWDPEAWLTQPFRAMRTCGPIRVNNSILLPYVYWDGVEPFEEGEGIGNKLEIIKTDLKGENYELVYKNVIRGKPVDYGYQERSKGFWLIYGRECPCMVRSKDTIYFLCYSNHYYFTTIGYSTIVYKQLDVYVMDSTSVFALKYSIPMLEKMDQYNAPPVGSSDSYYTRYEYFEMVYKVIADGKGDIYLYTDNPYVTNKEAGYHWPRRIIHCTSGMFYIESYDYKKFIDAGYLDSKYPDSYKSKIVRDAYDNDTFARLQRYASDYGTDSPLKWWEYQETYQQRVNESLYYFPNVSSDSQGFILKNIQHPVFGNCSIYAEGSSIEVFNDTGTIKNISLSEGGLPSPEWLAPWGAGENGVDYNDVDSDSRELQRPAVIGDASSTDKFVAYITSKGRSNYIPYSGPSTVKGVLGVIAMNDDNNALSYNIQVDVPSGYGMAINCLGLISVNGKVLAFFSMIKCTNDFEQFQYSIESARVITDLDLGIVNISIKNMYTNELITDNGYIMVTNSQGNTVGNLANSDGTVEFTTETTDTYAFKFVSEDNPISDSVQVNTSIGQTYDITVYVQTSRPKINMQIIDSYTGELIEEEMIITILNSDRTVYRTAPVTATALFEIDYGAYIFTGENNYYKAEEKYLLVPDNPDTLDLTLSCKYKTPRVNMKIVDNQGQLFQEEIQVTINKSDGTLYRKAPVVSTALFGIDIGSFIITGENDDYTLQQQSINITEDTDVLEITFTVVHKPRAFPEVDIQIKKPDKLVCTHREIVFASPNLSNGIEDPEWMVHFKVSVYSDNDCVNLINQYNTLENPSLFNVIDSNNNKTSFPVSGLPQGQYGCDISLYINILPVKEVYIVISAGAENA